jgi:hypothetical protein
MTLRPSLFWDSDVETIDLIQHKEAIIERTVLRGRLEEFQELRRFYGDNEVKDAVLNARWLDKTTLAFCSTLYKTSITEFRCYKLAQSSPEHWNY